MELGGNAPFIVFEDADIELAASGLVQAKFRNNGQTCVSPNRIFVHESVFNAFAASFIAKVKALTIGHGLEDGVDIGPLINEAAVQKTTRLLHNAMEHGGKILHANKLPSGLKGNYVPPTVLLANSEMLVAKEEIFWSHRTNLFLFK